jgi:hypothetical protein
MEIDILNIDKNIRDKWKMSDEKMKELEKEIYDIKEILDTDLSIHIIKDLHDKLNELDKNKKKMIDFQTNLNFYIMDVTPILESYKSIISQYSKISFMSKKTTNQNDVRIIVKKYLEILKTYHIDYGDLDDIVSKNNKSPLKRKECKKCKVSNYGFIMLRHINSEVTNKYWIESYKCIRKYYNNRIIIIDDNSDINYVNNDIDLINCDILQSEFPCCGELLGYYYFHKYHFFEKAIIIHDSTFINKFIDFSKFKNYKIKYLWHFTHDWDNIEEETHVLNYFNNDELNNFYYKKDEWYGCYGLQTYIDYNFLDSIVKKYDLFILLKYINNRQLRMNLERVLSVIFSNEYEPLRKDPSIYGIIHHYIHWGYLFENYNDDKKNKKLENYDLLKVWSGR